MKNPLHTTLRWENYRDFFHITIFRYLVLWFTLVPLFASALSGLKTPLTLTVGHQTFSLALALPFSWQLLWVSSFFFFVALVVYHLRCPSFIKKYHNFSEYQEYAHDQRWLAHEVKELATAGIGLSTFTEVLITKGFAKRTSAGINDAKNPAIENKQTVFRYRHADTVIEVGAPVRDAQGEVVADSERGLFWEIFSTYSASRVFWRVVIVFFLALSLLCFLIVLSEHIVQGFAYVLQWVRNGV